MNAVDIRARLWYNIATQQGDGRSDAAPRSGARKAPRQSPPLSVSVRMPLRPPRCSSAVTNTADIFGTGSPSPLRQGGVCLSACFSQNNTYFTILLPEAAVFAWTDLRFSRCRNTAANPGSHSAGTYLLSAHLRHSEC